MSEAVAQKVISAIAKMKKVPPETITMDSTLDELKMDSLDGLNLFFELEEAFDTTISDEQARAMRTVGQIVAEIQRLLADRSPSQPGSPAQG
jgi:acyl carrier protein